MFRFKNRIKKYMIPNRTIQVNGYTNYKTSLLVKYTSFNNQDKIVESLIGSFNFRIDINSSTDFKISFYVNNPLMKMDLILFVSLKELEEDLSIIKELNKEFLIGINLDQIQWNSIEF